MKRIAKLITTWILIVASLLPCATAFAEDAKNEDADSYGKYVEMIAKNISVFGRYENLFEEDLYLAALTSILEENPELYEKAVRAMLDAVDENSEYYDAEEAKIFLTNLDDEVIGIGVNVLSSDGKIIVSQPVPGSPAEKAGIKSGDIIIAADGVSLENMEFETALERIRGKEGTTVKITVVRSGISTPLTFTIVREKVTSNPVDLEIIEEEGKRIAKLTIYSFTENVAKNFAEALAKVDKEKIKNIIIDLRDNGGGYLSQAVEIADMFLPEGAVITTEDHKMDMLDKVYVAKGEKVDYDVIVLINGMSASASEVLTAALMENGVARVLGETSFGKGTVQTMYNLPNDAVMKFTIAYYLTPLGNNIHKKGITPHAIVKNSTVPVDMTEFEMFNLKTKYKLGDKGEEIENAKKMLAKLGIFVGTINDVYDENLKIAVNMFQTAKGLFPYGVLDITTQMNLYDTMKTAKTEVDDQLQAAIDAF